MLYFSINFKNNCFVFQHLMFIRKNRIFESNCDLINFIVVDIYKCIVIVILI